MFIATLLTSAMAHVDTHGVLGSMEATECPAVLERIASQIDEGDTADALFAVRRALTERIGALSSRGPVPTACIDASRRFDVAIRRAIDVGVQQGRAGDWLTAHGFGEIRSGDVLVTRGDGLSSAGIALIGAVDSHFSHNAMVHVDASGQAWTVEAYLEKGAMVQPLEDFLEHGLGRVAVLRYEDPTLAARGAELAFERITEGPAMDYDPAFDDADRERLFCSEIAGWALEMAGGPTDVPMFPTAFRDNPDLMDGMSIERSTFSAPSDLLFDPRFELVAEWRSVDALDAMARQDRVVGTVFGWMENDGYTVHPRWSHRATVDVGLAARRTPGIGALLADRVHPHSERDFLVYGLALQSVGEALYTELEEDLSDSDAVPTDAEIDARLEAIRTADEALYNQRPRRARLHRVLHR